MHVQQGTFKTTPEQINNAVVGVWERGGYCRPAKDQNSIDVVCNPDQLQGIREFLTAGAPDAAVVPQPPSGTNDAPAAPADAAAAPAAPQG